MLISNLIFDDNISYFRIIFLRIRSVCVGSSGNQENNSLDIAREYLL